MRKQEPSGNLHRDVKEARAREQARVKGDENGTKPGDSTTRPDGNASHGRSADLKDQIQHYDQRMAAAGKGSKQVREDG